MTTKKRQHYSDDDEEEKEQIETKKIKTETKVKFKINLIHFCIFLKFLEHRFFDFYMASFSES